MNESKFENKISEKLPVEQGKAKINENFYSTKVSDIKESNFVSKAAPEICSRPKNETTAFKMNVEENIGKSETFL